MSADYIKKLQWAINYGKSLLDDNYDVLLNDESISNAKLLKIVQLNEFCKSIIFDQFTELNQQKLNYLIHVYFHTLNFLDNRIIQLQSSNKTSMENRFRNYFKQIDGDPIQNLRNELINIRSTGASSRCTVCDQHVKEYRKSLSSNSARFLFSLVSISKTKKDGWVHYSDCIYHSRNYPEVAYWGLAHTKSDESKQKKTSGYWKPTQLGIDFVKNKNVTIPKYVHIYNGKITKIDDSTKVSILDALGTKFDYSELMKSF